MFPAVKVASAKQTVPDRCPGHQRGFLLMTSVVLIVIAALLLTVMMFLGVTGNESSVGHSQSGQALFIGETGLERALRGYNTGTTCNSLAYNANIGGGSFSTTGTSTVASVVLGANITAMDTVIPVASTAAFATHGRLRIENEDIDYAAKTATSFTGARRGVNGTTAVAHNTGAGVNVAQNQCLIRSTGTVAGTRRDLEKVIQNPGAMMVYAKANGDGNVYYRRWDGTNWGPERTAIAVPADIHFIVLKFSRTRNEAMLGTLSSNGEIRIQMWNGSGWVVPPTMPTPLADVGDAGDSEFRSFDIEYETGSDRAIVVYKDLNGSLDPDYRIWDGTAWSGWTDINLPTTGEVRWIELAPHPSSNEISMITLDSNTDVKGMRWTGAAWDEMGGLGTWDTSAADSGQPNMNPSKVIDVAYEQLSGHAMFIWGDTTATDNFYRIWDGATLSVANILLDIPAMNDEADWVRLVPRPNSDQLMYGVQDGARDLNTALWSGLAWTVHGEHDTGTEDTSHRNFDIVFETHPINAGQAWLVWGTEPPGGGPNGIVRVRRWTGAAWVPAPPAVGTAVLGSDDTGLVQLVAHPTSGAIFAGIYEDTSSVSDDISEMRQVNGVQTWSGYIDMWAGATVGDPVLERIFIAPERNSQTMDWREIFP